MRFRAAAASAGATAGEAPAREVAAALLACWSEPHRHYHTVEHLVAVLNVVDAYADLAVHPDLVRLAAWCHDAVYDPRAAGDANERASAALARDLLVPLGLTPHAVREVGRLVRLTADHKVATGDPDGGLLCDADLAILASPPREYDRYAAAVRREYAHVPNEVFRAGRAAVLDRLLALPALFRSPPLSERYERSARANLMRELTALRQ